MGTATLRPNASIQAGTSYTPSSGATQLTYLSDNSDGTAVTHPPNEGLMAVNAAIPSSYAAVNFTNATGTLPASRKILSVAFYYRGYSDYSANSSGGGWVQYKYSDNIDIWYGGDSTASPGSGAYRTYSTTLSQANRADGGTTKGAWTYALVDGIKAAFGGAGGPSHEGVGPSDLWLVVTYSDLPPVPTAVAPLSGSTVSTSKPNVSATVGACATGQKSRMEWQIAQDSGFTTGLRTITEPTSNNRTSGSTNYAWPSGVTALTQGTWYLRARQLDEYGNYGSYSATTSFTVSHLPAATGLNPTGDTYRPTGNVTFSWNFTDPYSGDTQTAYQLVIEKNSDGTAVLDTGKVASVTSSAIISMTDPTNKDAQLRWKLALWDADDVQGLFSSYSLFRYGDLPSASITYPTSGGTVDNPAPTITWTFTSGGGGRTQKSAAVTIRDASTTEVVWSGSVVGATTSITPSSPVLINGTSYTVQVVVTDTADLTANSSTLTFSAVWTPPAASTISVGTANYASSGYVDLNWTMTTDPAFATQRIYRLKPSKYNIDLEDDQGILQVAQWELIYETSDGLMRSFKDYSAPSGYSTSYKVNQVVTRFGSFVEANSTPQSVTIPQSSNYWLIDPDNDTHNVRLGVTSDEFHNEIETVFTPLIGRGRHVSYGDDYGVVGSITAQIYNQGSLTAREVRLALEQIKRRRKALYLTNPFGDVWLVGTGDMSISRIAGAGTSEFFTVSFDYSEVA